MAIYIDRNKPSSGLANLLASKGRHGDTELVHMTKPEIQRLRNTGLMTLNPKTGLPEMFLGDVFKGLKTYAKNFLKPKNLIPTIAGIAGGMFLGPMIGNAAPFLRSFAPSIGKAAGILGGGVLTGRPVDEVAPAAVTAGVLDYGMSKIGDMFRPGPAAYGLEGQGKGLSRAQLKDMRDRVGSAEVDFEWGGVDVGADDYVSDIEEGDFYSKIKAPEKLQPFMTGKVDDQGLAKFRNQFNRLSGADQQRLTGWTPASDPAKARTFIAGEVENVVNPEEVGTFQFGGLGADKAARNEAFNKYLMNKRLLSTPKMRAQALDPWGNFKDTGRHQLMSGDIKAGLQTIPVGELLSDVATTQEALGLTDMLAEQEKLTEEEMKGLTQLASRGTYTPTRPGGVRYFTPTRRTAIIPRRADKGGLVSLAHGGDMRRDFEGLVQGRGHGMQDNVIMDIKQKGGLLAVSPKEYVVPADIMSGLGNGNPDAGAEHMDKFISDFRKKKYGRDKQPPEMDGGTALQSLMA